MKKQFTIKHQVGELDYILAIQILIENDKKVTKKSIENQISFCLEHYGDAEYWSVSDNEETYIESQKIFNKIFKKS